PLLDAVVDFLPSPLDVPPVEGKHPDKGDVITRKPSDDEPLAALAFKIATDKHVGQLTYVRIYSGGMKTGEQVLNASTGRKERIGRLLQMHANKRQELEEAYTGDIVAGGGPKSGATGQTLCAPRPPILPAPTRFPSP